MIQLDVTLSPIEQANHIMKQTYADAPITKKKAVEIVNNMQQNMGIESDENWHEYWEQVRDIVESTSINPL